MARKRPERTERRVQQRAARQLVRDRERLAALVAGGAPEHPLAVISSAVIEGRAEAMPCPQCEGPLRVREHRAERASLRAVDVRCQQCGVGRTLWFRIVADDLN